eukprot:jgi/Botrbrau1/4166/Bobra.0192s0033.1
MREGRHLELRTDIVNYHFENWRLVQNVVHDVKRHPLANRVYDVQAGGPDFLHARLSAFHNHLVHDCKDRIFFLTRGEQVEVHQANPGTHTAKCELFVCGLPWRVPDAPPKLDAQLNPTISVVEGTTSSATEECGSFLLISTGDGDLQLCNLKTTGADLSQRVYPLLARPPLVGCRSFCVEAAYLCSPGEIRAVVWGVLPKTDIAPAQFDAHVVTLQYEVEPLMLRITSIQLLCLTEYPLHAVIPDPANDGVVVAASPMTDSLRTQQHHNWGGRREEDDDDVSPRTLQAAAARLAKYTSEEEGGPSDQWADFFSQRTGADSTSSADPECIVYSFSCQPPPAGPPTPSPMLEEQASEPDPANEPAISISTATMQPLSQVSCLPHKLVAKGRWKERVLLGLSDDVDCAVVSLGLAPGAPSAPHLCHEASIPALSYVAAGKTQRKMVLLGRPGGCVAAVIIETQKYAYLFRPVASGQVYGEHQVFDLGLNSDTLVLGAALLDDVSSSRALLYVLTTNELLIVELS